MLSREKNNGLPLVARIYSGSIAKLRADMLFAGFFKGERPLKGAAGEADWLYNGVLSRLIVGQKIYGNFGEGVLIATQNRLQIPKILFIGLGLRRDFTYSAVNSIAKLIFRHVRNLDVKDFAVDFRLSEGDDHILGAEAFVKGLKEESKNEALENKEPEGEFSAYLMIEEKERAMELFRKVRFF